MFIDSHSVGRVFRHEPLIPECKESLLYPCAVEFRPSRRIIHPHNALISLSGPSHAPITAKL